MGLNWKDLTDEDYEVHWGFPIYKDKIILDLGADIGSSAFYFIEKGAKEVICVEGVNEMYIRLCDITRTNPKITSHLCMISSKEDMEKYLSMLADIVKIDIEGAEVYLFQVSDKILNLHKEYLIETHSNAIYIDMIKFLKEKGYKLESFTYDYEHNKRLDSKEPGMIKVIYAKK